MFATHAPAAPASRTLRTARNGISRLENVEQLSGRATVPSEVITMPEWTDQFTFTIPIIRYTMDSEDRSEGERQQPLAKKMSLLTPVKIETPDSGRRMSEPTRYYIPPQCNNRLSPRSARKRENRRNSKTDGKDDSPPKDVSMLGPKPCNCEECRASSPLPPGYGPQTMSPGYDQMKSSLLEVPWSEDYTEASSDDLSSEWDSDVPEPPRPVQKVMSTTF